MSFTVKAVYENGNFRALTPLNGKVRNGETVLLTINNNGVGRDNPILKATDNFYEGLSESEVDEIEKIILDRSNFFGERQP